VIPGRFNVVGVVDSGSPGRTLIFNGHLDTVPVCQGWTLDPYGGEIRDGCMYGHGIGDQKARIACQAIAALALKRSRIPTFALHVCRGNNKGYWRSRVLFEELVYADPRRAAVVNQLERLVTKPLRLICRGME
jgi:hypothetical protein